MVERPRIRVGPAGWSYADWEGRVYPSPHPRGFRPLTWLARYVDCVEVNATFYRTPSAKTVEGWVRAVEARPDFRFLVKLGQVFTHGDARELPAEEARRFLEALQPLVASGRLSAVLAQFPFFFRAGDEARERLGWIADAFASLPVVVELRSRTFFDEAGLAFLAARGLGLAHIDLPAARDHPPPDHACVGDIGYVRLHGRNAKAWFDRHAGRDDKYDYLYAPQELEHIARRLKEVAGQSRETFLVTNNHYGGQAVANALEMRGLLDRRPPRAPETLRDAFPHLADVTRPEGQQRLF